jgi:uncharacterized membrane protein YdjX (TVP38/TMEM64 family)
VFLVFLVALLALSRILPVTDWIRLFLDWVRGLGLLGPIVLGVAYIVACVFFVPGFLLTLGAGTLFGVVTGAITVSIASTLGATAAFLIGRYFARDAIAARVARYPSFQAIDEAVAREGWKIVGLVRLSPVFPFNLVNYAFGLTRVSLRNYAIASWIGMMPGTLLYVYIGSLLGDIAALGAGSRTRSPAEWAFYALGLCATIAVTIYVTRVARRALAERIAAPE